MKNNLLTLIMCVAALAFTTTVQAQVELYKADFTAGEPADWVIVAGDWQVRDNTVIGEAKQYSSDAGQSFWTYYNGASFDNYEVEMVIYPTWSNPVGLIFNMTDTDNYFILEVSGRRKASWIWQVENGDFINGYHINPKVDEPQNHFFLHANWAINSPWIETDPDPSNYYTVNLKCDANGLTTVTINGDVAFTDLDDVGASGKLGVWANWNPTFVKSFVVNSLGSAVVNYTLTVNQGSGSGDYEEGTEVAIVADAAPAGQIFSQWTGDIATVADVNAASTTITMPAANANLTATYITEPAVGVIQSYTADFSGGEAQDWVIVAGDWQVRDNSVIGETKQYSSDGGERFWTYYNGGSFENYEVELVMYPTWSNPFGLVFNMTDTDNYFILELSGRRKAAWIWEVQNGEFVDGYHFNPKVDEPQNHFFLHANWAINSPWIETDPDPSNYYTVNLKNNANGLTTVTINDSIVFTDLDDVGAGGRLGVWANWNPTFVKSFEVKPLSNVNVAELSLPKITIYPNPVVDILNFSSMIENIEVFNITGMKVRSALNADAIDMSGLESGLYFIRLNSVEIHKIMVR